MKFRVHIETDEDGVFVAECPTLPGCISQDWRLKIGSQRDVWRGVEDAEDGRTVAMETALREKPPWRA